MSGIREILGDSAPLRLSMGRSIVCGAGGFIGHHLVKRLKAEGQWVRGVDIKRPDFEESPADDFLIADLREHGAAPYAFRDVDDVYQLAADMGGIGYITGHHAEIATNNTRINLNCLMAAVDASVQRYLFTSSACVYPAHLQRETMGRRHLRDHDARAVSAPIASLAEQDAIPADPEPGYGWEKLYAEQLTSYYGHDHGLSVRIVRLHNVYGPLGTYDGGREKAPAALCRKVALAESGSSIEVWGDGQQTRSFMYVDDCVDGLLRLMATSFQQPINLGTEELVTVDELVGLVALVADKRIEPRHNTNKPQGVRGRNSDNLLLRNLLGWEPSTSLLDGLRKTYPWIASQVVRAQASAHADP
jgi:GDP-D-mannose 3', 5'-epimerase